MQAHRLLQANRRTFAGEWFRRETMRMAEEKWSHRETVGVQQRRMSTRANALEQSSSDGPF